MRITLVGAVILIGGFFILLAALVYAVENNGNRKDQANGEPNPPTIQ
jgi:hypothetical protein